MWPKLCLGYHRALWVIFYVNSRFTCSMSRTIRIQIQARGTRLSRCTADQPSGILVLWTRHRVQIWVSIIIAAIHHVLLYHVKDPSLQPKASHAPSGFARRIAFSTIEHQTPSGPRCLLTWKLSLRSCARRLNCAMNTCHFINEHSSSITNAVFKP